ncbi:MAG TPA: PepSY domain-containing protein [Halococcus sp.]|nr:PepSY domain-containing protein [Halococcus sp.]
MDERDQPRTEPEEQREDHDRRRFLRLSAVAGATLAVPGLIGTAMADGRDHDPEDNDHDPGDDDDRNDRDDDDDYDNDDEGPNDEGPGDVNEDDEDDGDEPDDDDDQPDGDDAFEDDEDDSSDEDQDDSDDDRDDDGETADTPPKSGQGGITEQEAGRIATARVGGTVRNVELERENGIVVYEVEVRKRNGPDKEVDVRRQTGEIVGIENESDEDSD